MRGDEAGARRWSKSNRRVVLGFRPSRAQRPAAPRHNNRHNGRMDAQVVGDCCQTHHHAPSQVWDSLEVLLVYIKAMAQTTPAPSPEHPYRHTSHSPTLHVASAMTIGNE